MAALERHHRTRDGDTSLLFDFHPVRLRPPAVATRANLASLVDRSRRLKEGFGKRRLAGVRMGDDRERASLERGAAKHAIR